MVLGDLITVPRDHIPDPSSIALEVADDGAPLRLVKAGDAGEVALRPLHAELSRREMKQDSIVSVGLERREQVRGQVVAERLGGEEGETHRAVAQRRLVMALPGAAGEVGDDALVVACATADLVVGWADGVGPGGVDLGAELFDAEHGHCGEHCTRTPSE